MRYRKSLIEERSRDVNRLQKILEGCNIKLSSVASDITGVSARSMIEAIISNINDPKLLSKLAKGRLQSKKENLEQALHGLVGPHQRKMLAAQLDHIDFLGGKIKELDHEVEDRQRPFEEELELLDTIPGVGRRSAEVILAEIGTDMDRFPSDAHLASLAGMSPGSNESACKRLWCCHKMGINVWEVIDAARIKPYGLQAFYPRPGVGIMVQDSWSWEWHINRI